MLTIFLEIKSMQKEIREKESEKDEHEREIEHCSHEMGFESVFIVENDDI